MVESSYNTDYYEDEEVKKLFLSAKAAKEEPGEDVKPMGKIDKEKLKKAVDAVE